MDDSEKSKNVRPFVCTERAEHGKFHGLGLDNKYKNKTNRMNETKKMLLICGWKHRTLKISVHNLPNFCGYFYLEKICRWHRSFVGIIFDESFHFCRTSFCLRWLRHAVRHNELAYRNWVLTPHKFFDIFLLAIFGNRPSIPAGLENGFKPIMEKQTFDFE